MQTTSHEALPHSCFSDTGSGIGLRGAGPHVAFSKPTAKKTQHTDPGWITILGWPKSSLGVFLRCYGKTQTNPISFPYIPVKFLFEARWGGIANCASQPPSKRRPQGTLGVAGVKGAGPGALFFSLVLKKPFCYSMMTIVNSTVWYI